MTSKVIDPIHSSGNIHQDIINGCFERDQKAQFQFYKLYYKAMYNTSFRIVSNSMEAEDIMQESFLFAFETIETFSGSKSFGDWLKRIVIKRSVERLNSNRKVNFNDVKDYTGNLPDYDTDLTSEGEIDYNIEDVKEIIGKLPDAFRIVLSLYLLEGYDYCEISELLSISEYTARIQLSKARQKVIGDLETRNIFREKSGS